MLISSKQKFIPSKWRSCFYLSLISLMRYTFEEKLKFICEENRKKNSTARHNSWVKFKLIPNSSSFSWNDVFKKVVWSRRWSKKRSIGRGLEKKRPYWAFVLSFDLSGLGPYNLPGLGLSFATRSCYTTGRLQTTSSAFFWWIILLFSVKYYNNAREKSDRKNCLNIWRSRSTNWQTLCCD